MFEEKAGLVPITLMIEEGRPVGATLTAPQPFSRGSLVPAEDVAACLSLSPDQIRLDNHQPVEGSVGLPFVLAELVDRAALQAVRGDVAAMERVLVGKTAPDIHCYVRTGGNDTVDIRARMVAPLDGVPEDPATGSANAALMGLLAELDGPGDGTMALRIAQGVEMGRPSLLAAAADRAGGVTTAIRVGGRCVAMMRGEIVAPGV